VANEEPNRRALRELLFTTPNFEKHISGVILFEETLFQKAADGTPMVELLQKRGVIPGIKVDKGVVLLPGTNGETETTGLDGLGDRCAKYYQVAPCIFLTAAHTHTHTHTHTRTHTHSSPIGAVERSVGCYDRGTLSGEG
jgi:fructose-bisphosphate aldolase class I